MTDANEVTRFHPVTRKIAKQMAELLETAARAATPPTADTRLDSWIAVIASHPDRETIGLELVVLTQQCLDAGARAAADTCARLAVLGGEISPGLLALLGRKSAAQRDSSPPAERAHSPLNAALAVPQTHGARPGRRR